MTLRARIEALIAGIDRDLAACPESEREGELAVWMRRTRGAIRSALEGSDDGDARRELAREILAKWPRAGGADGYYLTDMTHMDEGLTATLALDDALAIVQEAAR